MEVEQFYNKNQFVIHADDTTTLRSYNSTIARLFNGVFDGKKRVEIGGDWDYSKTTLKHFYLFLRDYLPEIWQNLEYQKNKKQKFVEILNKGGNDAVRLVKMY